MHWKRIRVGTRYSSTKRLIVREDVQYRDFAATYESMGEAQLLELATQRDQLVDLARLALESELARRQLPAQSDRGSIGREILNETDGEKDGTSSWYAQNLKFCRTHLAALLKVVAPAAVLGYMAIAGSLEIVHRVDRQLRQEIATNPAMLPYFPDRLEFLVLGISRWVGLYLSWLLSCAAFAAVASLVISREEGQETGVGGYYRAVREHLGPFLKSTTALFLLVVCGLTGTGFILLSFVSGFLRRDNAQAITYAATVLIVILWIWLLARFALVVPIVAAERIGTFKAFQASERLSEPIRGRIFLLLLESEVLGFCLVSLPFWIVRSAGLQSLQSWEYWLAMAASVAGGALAQLPMMVGISKAYLEVRGAQGPVTGVTPA
jgi:hypothetical protein